MGAWPACSAGAPDPDEPGSGAPGGDGGSERHCGWRPRIPFRVGSAAAGSSRLRDTVCHARGVDGYGCSTVLSGCARPGRSAEAVLHGSHYACGTADSPLQVVRYRSGCSRFHRLNGLGVRCSGRRAWRRCMRLERRSLRVRPGGCLLLRPRGGARVRGLPGSDVGLAGVWGPGLPTERGSTV